MEQYRELFKIKRLKACQHQLFEENTHSLLYRFDIIKPLCHKCSEGLVPKDVFISEKSHITPGNHHQESTE